MDLSTRTVLVTGASRGFGRALAAELLGRGAAVYAGARDPGQVDLPGAKPIALDITDPTSVAAAAKATGDVTVLINNAGSSTGSDLLAGDLNDIRLEMDTHYFGTLSVVRGFAPQIAANGGGAILNILSGLSWVSFPEIGAYCAAKSAEWSLTNALRVQLAGQGIRVAGLHVGYMDTDMVRTVTAPKSDPADIARIAVDGIAAGAYEILADNAARRRRPRWPQASQRSTRSCPEDQPPGNPHRFCAARCTPVLTSGQCRGHRRNFAGDRGEHCGANPRFSTPTGWPGL